MAEIMFAGETAEFTIDTDALTVEITEKRENAVYRPHTGNVRIGGADLLAAGLVLSNEPDLLKQLVLYCEIVPVFVRTAQQGDGTEVQVEQVKTENRAGAHAQNVT
jgi:hypothetical protein